MKTLLLLLICALLPISVDAGVKFETLNASNSSWDIDTTCLDWVDFSDSIAILTASDDFFTWTSDDVVTPQKLKHDTNREYIVGLDTVYILHRVECDTGFTYFYTYSSLPDMIGPDDTLWATIDIIECDTIFRVDFRDVWAPKVRVYLDSLLWQKLLRILEE